VVFEEEKRGHFVVIFHRKRKKKKTTEEIIRSKTHGKKTSEKKEKLGLKFQMQNPHERTEVRNTSYHKGEKNTNLGKKTNAPYKKRKRRSDGEQKTWYNKRAQRNRQKEGGPLFWGRPKEGGMIRKQGRE